MSGRRHNLTETQKSTLKEFYRAFYEFIDHLPAESSGLEVPQPKEKIGEKSPGLGFLGLRNKAQKAKNTKGDIEENGATLEPECMSKDLFLKELFGVIQFDHPDDITLRFLRARKWDVKESLKMLSKAVAWFHSVNISKVKRIGETEINMDLVKKGEIYFQGSDIDGRPICYVNTKHHDPKALSIDEVQNFTLWVMETSRLLFVEPVDTVAILFDMTDFAASSMDFASVKFLINVLEKDYPESLGRIMILNAPWFFSGIWKMISAMLDPVVVAKIKFVSTKELHELVSVSQLRKELGGTGTIDFNYIEPKPEENSTMNDVEGHRAAEANHLLACAAYETATRAWMMSPDGSSSDEREAAVLKFREASKSLDPFIRARTIYHRLDVIREIGDVDWTRIKNKS